MSRHRTRILPYVILAALAPLTACGDDGDDFGPNDNGPLSVEEARYIGEIIVSQSYEVGTAIPVFQSRPALSVANGGSAAATDSVEVTASRTLDCPLGGSVAADASILAVRDETTGAVEAELLVSHEHQGCVVQAPESGRQFTLDGAPAIVTDYLFATDASGTFSTDGSVSGAVDWATDGASGTCEFDVEVVGTRGIGQPIAISISGTVCGESIDQSVSVPAGD